MVLLPITIIDNMLSTGHLCLLFAIASLIIAPIMAVAGSVVLTHRLRDHLLPLLTRFLIQEEDQLHMRL
jgi:hypothetical protein